MDREEVDRQMEVDAYHEATLKERALKKAFDDTVRALSESQSRVAELERQLAAKDAEFRNEHEYATRASDENRKLGNELNRCAHALDVIRAVLRGL